MFNSLIDKDSYTCYIHTENIATNPTLRRVARPLIERALPEFHPINLLEIRVQDFIAYLTF